MQSGRELLGGNMPWRKYTPQKGKHGDIYHISEGVQVRMDQRCKWTIFINKNNERRSKTIGTGRSGLAKSIKAAEAIASELTSFTLQGQQEQPVSALPRFKDYSKKWLDENRLCWRESTFVRYGEILRLHILPSSIIGSKRIDELDRFALKKFLRSLYQIRSPATVELAHVVFSNIFEEAIDDGLIQANPVRKLLRKILPPQHKRNLSSPMPLNREEQNLLIQKAISDCSLTEQLTLKVMLYGGFRLGETLAMRAKHLNFVNRTYLVSESYKSRQFNKPKSSKPRQVDLPDFLLTELKKLITNVKKEKLKAGKGGKVDLIFLDPGEDLEWPYSQRKIQGLMRRLCKKAKIERRSPHDLRHTYASKLLMSHMSPAYVQRQLGHSSIKITVDTYGHWIQGEGRDGLEQALNPVPNRDGSCIYLHMQKQKSK